MSKNFDPHVIRETSEGFQVVTLDTETLARRVVGVFGLVDDTLANNVFAQFKYLESLSEDPIDVVINSGGGSIDAGMAIYDLIRASNARIRTIVIGAAFSIASAIAVSGDERLIFPSAHLMIHEPASVASTSNALAIVTNASQMKYQSDNLDAAKESLVELYAKHTALDKDEIHAYMKGIGTSFDAEQALKLGFVDGIVPYANKKGKKND